MTEAQRQDTARPTRKELGAWYTPPALVTTLVRETLFDGARSVLDPACGDGRFLRATGLPEQTGVDIDPLTGFIHDDALQRDWGDEQFDIVIGTPPASRLVRTASFANATGERPHIDIDLPGQLALPETRNLSTEGVVR